LQVKKILKKLIMPEGIINIKQGIMNDEGGENNEY